jgi:murein L,D-transpeptidase YafK
MLSVMKRHRAELILVFTLVIGVIPSGYSQPSVVDMQRSYARVAVVFSRWEDSLKNEFSEKKLSWPPTSLYIRCFKYDRAMEIWVNGNEKEPFRLLKTYEICMQSGALGPKRMEGDYQVPEGFYYINELNPNSNYHLSLGLNYPNASDRILSDSLHPGGDIYIHGNCVSVGCIPIKDDPIEELYILTTHVKQNGQDFIPVHVFPVRYDVKKSMDYLAQSLDENRGLRKFEQNLKMVYDHFEEKKHLPVISVNKKGDYVIY